MSLPEAFALIADLASRRGVSRINQLPGCYEFALPDGWEVSVNGHREPRKNIHGDPVPPFHALVQRHGWPALLMSPAGGEVLGDATEDDFIAALRAAGASLPTDTGPAGEG